MVIIENVPAGSVLSDLGFFCLDEAQQPVHGGILGKVQLSWSRGSKNVVLEEGIVCLPDMPVSLDTLCCVTDVSQMCMLDLILLVSSGLQRELLPGSRCCCKLHDSIKNRSCSHGGVFLTV